MNKSSISSLLPECQLIVTCEHGGNDVPQSYKKLFEKGQKVLNSHRGYDQGALELAKELSVYFQAPLYVSTITRLLIELNRSIGSASLYSSFTCRLTRDQKEELKRNYYFPYRNKVEVDIDRWIKHRKQVLHISVHSFTPELDGKLRYADIGLLYDPKRILEYDFCKKWQKTLRKHTHLQVRRNYPYRGKSDGFTTYLRSRYPQKNYLGIEIEINQKFPQQNKKQWKLLKEKILCSLDEEMNLAKKVFL